MNYLYILTNQNGILLGVFREKKTAQTAINTYLNEYSIINEPKIILYEVTSAQANLPVANRFKVIWETPSNTF